MIVGAYEKPARPVGEEEPVSERPERPDMGVEVRAVGGGRDEAVAPSVARGEGD